MKTGILHAQSISFTGIDPEKWLHLCTKKHIKVFTAPWFAIKRNYKEFSSKGNERNKLCSYNRILKSN